MPTELLVYTGQRPLQEGATETTAHLQRRWRGHTVRLCSATPTPAAGDCAAVYLALDSGHLWKQPDLFINVWQELQLQEVVSCPLCQQAYAELLYFDTITAAKFERLPNTPPEANPRRPPGSGPTRLLTAARKLLCSQVGPQSGNVPAARKDRQAPTTDAAGRGAAAPDLFTRQEPRPAAAGLAAAAEAIPAGRKRRTANATNPETLTPYQMEKQLATKIYNQVIADLHSQISSHPSPTPEGGTKQSIAAFALAYGLSRQNLQKVFTLGTNSVSVGVYIRILIGLGHLPADYLQGLDAAEFDLPLRLYLCLNHNLLTSSLLAVRTATLPPAPVHV